MMNLSPPIPWRDVPVGAVVLLDQPRTVLANTVDRHGLYCEVLIEGRAEPAHVEADGPNGLVQLVLLDDADAVATLAAAGLNPEPVEGAS